MDRWEAPFPLPLHPPPSIPPAYKLQPSRAREASPCSPASRLALPLWLLWGQGPQR